MSSSPFRISSKLQDQDLDVIHRYLSEQAPWCLGIPKATLAQALAHSLCFGAFLDGAQVGFARVVTDRTTFAYLCDVFVLPEQQGRACSRALMDAVMAHPDLQTLRRFLLATSTAAGLYAKYGFTPSAKPQAFMERLDPEIYSRAV
ncbi:GNAT family N-acetyltransferase [Paucibacter sp. DJ2R-2]|uniref:GNAT family N-acetyltransferase n=1 Tax=Paucibacter sp. DJ2R-2 TaxID=2893558 RepID=UPI0021E3AE6E|nr:GNAT family N-acetyltransferase [Paucibacter sp. DJ2R-2]MCV2421219.1 GNAT family N-acetyltransferase [Paucibacter sp. DJ4R-1]MCV2439197.1 GNAT family N-acetyltransferase [Paucibacter sp. DJ2R-2]